MLYTSREPCLCDCAVSDSVYFVCSLLSAAENIKRGGEARGQEKLMRGSDVVTNCHNSKIRRGREGSSFLQDSFILGILPGTLRRHFPLSDDNFAFRASLHLFSIEQCCPIGFSTRIELFCVRAVQQVVSWGSCS